MSETTPPTERPGFTSKVDLAGRLLGGAVVAASDELFAERENLIKPETPSYQRSTFGHKGQVYDGWETRRRRQPGSDWALVRLGVAGIVRGVVVDTAFFTGNYAPAVSVQATAVEGYPSPQELLEADWITLVPESPCGGDRENFYDVDNDHRFTHVRLNLHPDGGVARVRVHGDVVADPRFLAAGVIDLAALENGGRVTGCSNMFYSSPTALIAPGQARTMGEGWETARRREGGNDYVELDLAGRGVVHLAELDTRYFLGNAPGWASLTGSGPGGPVEILPKTRLQPDTRHRFLVSGAGHDAGEVERVRLDVYPDGGMARLRLWGELSERGRAELTARWFDALPPSHVRAVTESGWHPPGAGR